MKSETPLDYAVFQLSPKRSRCELFVSSDGNTEKLASGLVKPFVTHLKVVEEQVASAVQSIKLEIERRKNVETWFTKGTLERFVRFVSTPEVLELVNTFDAEMSQLEAARRIYSQGAGDQPSSTLGVSGTGTTAVADATKKELLRAIDVRLVAVRQDLTTACARAAAAGFNPDTVSELQMFADRFGAHRLNEACSNFASLCERRPDLINSWKAGMDDRAVRSSYGSDMSIDEDPTTEEQHPSLSHPHKHATGREPDATQQHLEQSKISTSQQQPNSSSSTFLLRRSRESSIEKDIGRESDEAFEKEKKEESGTQTGPPARRLSVQDRINLFETKQKEVSGSGGKPIAVAKSVELRRLSSDVSSAPAVVEKAVLRRWSGVSDMSISIDLTGEKKETDSPLYTPSEDRKGLNDTAATAKPEFRSVPARVDDCGSNDQADSQTPIGVISGEEFDTAKAGANSGTELTVSSGRSIEAYGSNKSTSTLETDEIRHKTRSSSSLSCAEDNNLKNQATSQSQSRFFSGGNADQFGLTAHTKLKDSVEFAGIENKVASEMQIAGLREKAAPPALLGAFASRVGDIRSADESYKSYQHPRVENLDQGEDVGLRDQSVPQSRFRTPTRTAVDSGKLEGGSGSKIREAFAAQFKGTEGDLLASQPRWKSLGEVEEVGRKGFASSERQSDSSTKVEHSGFQRMKFQKEVSGPEQVKKAQARRDENSSVYGNNKVSFSGKMVSEDQEGFGSIPVPPVEHVRRVRQSKGNQELNDELTRKANDLEKSFAEHKLRFPGDQSNSKRRSKPTDTEIEQAASLPYRKQVEDIASPQFPDKNRVIASSGSYSNMVKLDASSVIDLVDNQDYGEALKQNFSELGFSDDSKGKFYDKYMQKRDAKLREEWGSKGVEKEAKMKAMQDSLEHSRAEMRAKFSGSADRQDSVFSARRRSERLRSFNTRSILKREQQPLDFVQSEDDEDPSEFSEQKPFGYDRSFSDASFGDGVSRSSQSKKLLPNRTLSSFTPRTSAAPIPRSVIKASNSSSGRRRMQSDNPLAQSVPNFSDLRKENTKPYSAVSKTTRPQLRNYSRSRGANEEMPQVREEKPRRSHSLRKSSASPVEFKETAPLNSEGGVVLALKFDTEQTERSLYDKFSRNVESKPFLRKNNGIGPGTGAGIAKLKASMMSEAMNNEEESDELAFEAEDLVDVVNDEEEFETMTSEDHADMDQGGARLSQESEKLVNSGSENGDTLQSFSQVDPSLVAELPAAVSSTFRPVGPLQDSPGESPMSWNSRIHHPFSYTHEASDIDASADSPMGSPASWNLHSLNQTEADAARMRKKWGSAQKPIIVANSSNNQSRKDVTKGFKRLLKFGRKSRGTEGLVDWVSATTSEGDDDTEDGRDPANRSSEDLRKSRMGFSQGHPSEDSFNESDFFSEEVQALRSSIPAPPANFKLREDHLSGSSMKAPRSFFSLSSFRSKGSDSKPR